MNKYLSPAKINWFLHITARRADGYHELETVFQRIDWYDELHITLRNDGQILLSGDLSGVAMSDNLAYRAARALQMYSPLGADIHLIKNIPTGAGLGGGSSNAATVLLALNQVWQLDLSNLTLQKIGLQLGADVPFFVSGFNAAYATGIGDVLQAIDLPARELLLVNPNIHVATAAIFNHPDLLRNHLPLGQSVAELAQNVYWDNDLEPITFARHHEVKSVHDALHVAAPDAYVRMSGSGASIFAAPFNPLQRQNLTHWQNQYQPKKWQSRWVNTLA